MSAPWAVEAQAEPFGTLHVAGFPAGAVGMALSFVYALVLSGSVLSAEVVGWP